MPSQEAPARPQTQFRGVFTPADIWNLFLDGTISANEMVLLQIIDSLVDAKGEGCWASNEYLADKLNLAVVSIKRLLKKLKDLNLVFVVQEGGGDQRRILETRWSRITENPSRKRDHPRLISETTPVSFSRPILGISINELENNTVPDSTSGQNTTEETMQAPFLIINESTNDLRPSKAEAEVTDWDKQASQKLLKALQAKGRVVKKSHKTSTMAMYAAAFTALRKNLDNNTTRIQATLDWYCEHIDGEYVPQAYSANSFYEKFIAIESAKARDEKRNPQVEVSDKVRSIVSRLKRKNWPKLTEDALLTLTQICHDRFLQFRAKVNTLGNLHRTSQTSPKQDLHLYKLSKFAAKLAWDEPGKMSQGRLPSPSTFAEEWMLDIWERISEWDGWSGRYDTLIFHLDSNDFKMWGRPMAADWSGEPEQWDALVKYIIAQP